MKTTTTMTALTALFLLATGCADDDSRTGEDETELFDTEDDDDDDQEDPERTEEDETEGEEGDDDGLGLDENVPGPDCGGDAIQIDAQPANVVFVLDRSGSMKTEIDGSGESRWSALHGVVSDLVGEYDEGMNFGAAMFPSEQAHTSDYEMYCHMNDSLEVEVASQNGDYLLSQMPAANSTPSGATPATAGVLNGLSHLESLEDDAPAAMILVTDGAANCAPGTEEGQQISVYDDELPEAVADAYERAGIPTYVVGIDIQDGPDQHVDVNTYQSLNEVAEKGGVPRDGEQRFYNTQSQQDLELALSDIAESLSCTLALNGSAPGPAYTEITIGGEVIEHTDDCENGNGWRFTSDNYPYNTIELCGTACDALQEVGSLEADYECPPEG